MILKVNTLKSIQINPGGIWSTDQKHVQIYSHGREDLIALMSKSPYTW